MSTHTPLISPDMLQQLRAGFLASAQRDPSGEANNVRLSLQVEAEALVRLDLSLEFLRAANRPFASRRDKALVAEVRRHSKSLLHDALMTAPDAPEALAAFRHTLASRLAAAHLEPAPEPYADTVLKGFGWAEDEQPKLLGRRTARQLQTTLTTLPPDAAKPFGEALLDVLAIDTRVLAKSAQCILKHYGAAVDGQPLHVKGESKPIAQTPPATERSFDYARWHLQTSLDKIQHFLTLLEDMNPLLDEPVRQEFATRLTYAGIRHVTGQGSNLQYDVVPAGILLDHTSARGR